MPQKASQARLVFLGAFRHNKNLTVAVGNNADGHQHGDIAHLTGPGAFRHDPIEIT